VSQSSTDKPWIRKTKESLVPAGTAVAPECAGECTTVALAPAAAAGPEAAVAMAALARVKHADGAVHADNGFNKTLPPSGLPGYDARENDRHTREAQPGPTSALHMSGAPEKAPVRRREGRPGALIRQL